MKIFVNNEIKNFILKITFVLLIFILISELLVWQLYPCFSLWLFFLFLMMACAILTICYQYFSKQNKIIEHAVSQINAYLDGDENARIESDHEGELYRLFHSINSLAAILNAHASNESREKEFLKNTISDISHQLKTPLSALNIYNGLMQEEAEELPLIKEFAELSEQELDRIETLVQNLLKITKLDAGTIMIKKAIENVGDILRDVELHFAYRAKQEQKEIILSGPDDVLLNCDRDWLIEAIDNIVKNALDHTDKGDTIHIEWKAFTSSVNISIKDNGRGIHPEDLHHIFKRFYRSRFSKDKQGIGLGLSLAKALIETNGGTIEVDSELGKGTIFTMIFLIPTKL